MKSENCACNECKFKKLNNRLLLLSSGGVGGCGVNCMTDDVNCVDCQLDCAKY